MYKEADVPPGLQEAAKLLEAQIKETQKNCSHVFEKVMGYDPNYSPRVDGRGVGDNVIKELHCSLCNLSKQFKELPFRVCHWCGGDMKVDHTEQFDGNRVTIHKCTSCGHEYDTT